MNFWVVLVLITLVVLLAYGFIFVAAKSLQKNKAYWLITDLIDKKLIGNEITLEDLQTLREELAE